MSENGSKARKDELMEVFSENDDSRGRIIERLVDEMVFLEKTMAEAKGMAFLEVNSKGEQRMTPAYKIYKDSLSQYVNTVRMLLSMTNKEGEDKKDSPLRAYFRQLAKDE